MARVLSHGGSCCGMRHLAGFNAQDNEETIRTALASAWVPRGVLVEAVLTNAQCNQDRLRHIPEALQRIGFKLVSRFKNPTAETSATCSTTTSTPAGLSSGCLSAFWRINNVRSQSSHPGPSVSSCGPSRESRAGVCERRRPVTPSSHSWRACNPFGELP